LAARNVFNIVDASYAKSLFALAALVGLTAGLAPSPALAADVEQQIGQQVYQQLQRKGEIISDSPLYSVLNPVADRIKRVADPQYQYPFHFILVHEKSPNAFAVPGGSVYVTDSLLHFVDNKEELAGVLCHETAHDIHHDVVNNMRKDQTQGVIISVLGALLGANRTGIGQFGENLAYTLQTSHFSRAVETAADAKGSETCAAAGYNPYGMVWLFRKFQKSGQGGSLEMLSDHPRDDHRISDLQTHFLQNPGVFGKFTNDIATATPLKLPAGGSSTTDVRPQPPASRAPSAPASGSQSGSQPADSQPSGSQPADSQPADL
jgi:predicted Zn-dependent protease